MGKGVRYKASEFDILNTIRSYVPQNESVLENIKAKSVALIDIAKEVKHEIQTTRVYKYEYEIYYDEYREKKDKLTRRKSRKIIKYKDYYNVSARDINKLNMIDFLGNLYIIERKSL